MVKGPTDGPALTLELAAAATPSALQITIMIAITGDQAWLMGTAVANKIVECNIFYSLKIRYPNNIKLFYRHQTTTFGKESSII
jgi:hypothetical protein